MRLALLAQACTLGLSALLSSAAVAQTAETQQRVERVAATLAAELATLCPAADVGDQNAFVACKQGLYKDSQLKKSLPDFVLWGRQRDPKTRLKDTKLTQFGPDAFTGLYLPMFMFNGKQRVEYVESEKLYQIRFETAFRNRLPPGQFPYPFWHEAEKWAMYEKANEIIVWWDAAKDRAKVIQFTVFGPNAPIASHTPVVHKFDGQWLWTDDSGKTQPQATVFDGMFRADNPYIGKLDAAYKTFALKMRDGSCNQCHVPNNPDGMKKLVLLQTPVHAASEIKRVLKTVRADTMPLDELGIEKPLDKVTKEALLKEGVVFDQLLDEAKAWEAAQDAKLSQK